MGIQKHWRRDSKEANKDAWRILPAQQNCRARLLIHFLWDSHLVTIELLLDCQNATRSAIKQRWMIAKLQSFKWSPNKDWCNDWCNYSIFLGWVEWPNMTIVTSNDLLAYTWFKYGLLHVLERSSSNLWTKDDFFCKTT